MRRALVIGASGGIGSAVAATLEERGAEIVRLSRSADGLDITDPASVSAAFDGLVFLGYPLGADVKVDPGAVGIRQQRSADNERLYEQFSREFFGLA